MDTNTAYEKDGREFNQFHQKIIWCRNNCGRRTTMTGTGLCDFCWEKGRRLERKQRREQ